MCIVEEQVCDQTQEVYLGFRSQTNRAADTHTEWSDDESMKTVCEMFAEGISFMHLIASIVQ